MSPIVPCPVCNRLTRPFRKSLWEYPDTVPRSMADGTCSSCYGRKREGRPLISHATVRPTVTSAPTRYPFTREQWMDDALCAQVDPERFFPEQGQSTRDAKSVCAACDVRAQCLEYALRNNEEHGVYGGLSERERRQLRRRSA